MNSAVKKFKSTWKVFFGKHKQLCVFHLDRMQPRIMHTKINKKQAKTQNPLIQAQTSLN